MRGYWEPDWVELTLFVVGLFILAGIMESI